MYGYLENETLHRAPNPLDVEDTRVWNPSNEQYEAAGYKKIIFTDPPETEPGYHAESGWEEQGDRIVQVWAVVKDPDDIDDSEAFDIIFGGAE